MLLPLVQMNPVGAGAGAGPLCMNDFVIILFLPLSSTIIIKTHFCFIQLQKEALGSSLMSSRN